MSSTWTPVVTPARLLKRRLDEKRAEAAEHWNAFDTARKAAIEKGDIKKATPELNQLHETYQRVAGEATELEDAFMLSLDRPANTRGRIPGIADALLRQLPGGAASLKAVTTVGAVTPSFFDPSIIDLPGAHQWIRSVIPTRVAETDVVSYVRQTSVTNAAAPVAAHGVKPESAIELTRVDAPVRVIAHVITGLDRSLLADQTSLEDFLDVTMRAMVLQAEQGQILNGTGAGVQLRGILNTVGISTVAKGGAESRSDVIRRAITSVELANQVADAIAIHPTNLLALRLEKDGDGAYLLGDAGEGDPQTLFGQLKVISTSVMPLGTALVGAYAESAIVYERESATVAISESHGDEFLSNELTIRAESRIALAVTRPAGFASVTAL